MLKLFYLPVLLLITLLSTPPVLAGHNFGAEGYYCDGNSIFHDVPGPQPEYGHTIKEDCGGDEICQYLDPPSTPNYQHEAYCQKTGLTPPKGIDTTMDALPNASQTVRQDSAIQFRISATNSCYQILNDGNLIQHKDPTQKPYFQTRGRVKNCTATVIFDKCTTKKVTTTEQARDDQNNLLFDNNGVPITRQVTRDVPCTADEDWKDNPLGDKKQHAIAITCQSSAIGSLNAPLVTPNGVCNNNIDYTVVAKGDSNPTADNCVPASGNRVTTSIGQTAPDALNAPTLADEQKRVELMSRGWLPEASNQKCEALKVADNSNNPVLPLGVKPDFFTGIRDAICSGVGGIINNIPGFAGGICRKTYYGEARDSRAFVDCADQLASADRPAMNPSPLPQQCDVFDYPTGPNGEMTPGKEAFDRLSTSLGTNVGISSNTLPTFENIPTNPRENISSQGQVFDASQIVPDIDARTNLHDQSFYPF